MSTKDFLKKIKDEDIEYVDVRFTDTRGTLQHVTIVSDLVDEDFIEEGFMFDGSSIAGWKSIEASDMKLMLDTDTAYVDPFYAEKTICVHCSIVEPDTNEPYERDPRGTAQKAEAYLKSSGIGDVAYMGPEAEFFLFDNVKFSNTINKVSYEVDASDASWNSDTDYEMGNMGHRPGLKGGYFPVNPIDEAQDLRAEMLSTMKRLGMKVDKHHHEVASCQHELGLIFGTLTTQADEMQKYKYVVHNVAHAYGKSATFMPKPIYGDNGSGMHVNMSIWKDGKPLFAGDKYADLSQEALYFIGGILSHSKSLNAFTNPTTNSYKRLIPGFEAPVLRAYSARNRSGCVRIPWTESPKAKRVEARFPDPAANPYLCFAALLMAGLDGIKNKIDPGEAMDKNLYDLPAEELADIPTVSSSLREALDELQADMDYLLAGDVFTKDQVQGYIDLKMAEVLKYDQTPHPVEFGMYYSC
ncbi:MAG: type I glutamate--ammonia ligase [Sulfitobacter litoralis]|jgi:glutamine synthetase|uniref:Glutamine synthetase n=2 Tax=root TaxID=1 RepID=A0A1H0ST97_9RHOB|nr:MULTISPECIES: type I glutamate--ammonia ligase [Sulfitobacter]MBQ0717842.1 type I glutamate--ammonia ligase [Sulfitobacter litoralis]MBQ0766880.1 type I glutamate--ammonia ligase [Sulfitobacter litoralis]MBQ0802898.1 type I glutamate--ammonia ligase [Sulfitobacter litoralis]MCF7726281.1 type I glutamate--ammonia ligase [Sulfitobacter sp. M22]MCF7777639.1 type I glutamate--ammonia ligase [Sulfitobacter sp. M220]|tara:strand:+ start:1869 stop:3275 length:1407 start_codon:yes stop_codon:yes gene_type:complete